MFVSVVYPIHTNYNSYCMVNALEINKNNSGYI